MANPEVQSPSNQSGQTASTPTTPSQNLAPLTLDITALKQKRQELFQLKEALQLKYNNLLGQIEVIDGLLAGQFSPKEASEKKE